MQTSLFISTVRSVFTIWNTPVIVGLASLNDSHTDWILIFGGQGNKIIQSNLNGLNTFGTMKICSSLG